MHSRKVLSIFKYTLVLFACLAIFTEQAKSEKIKFGNELSLFTSQQLKGYFQPLFTTVHESFNTNIHTNAIYSDYWDFGMNLSVMGMMVPNSDLTYSAELPEGYDGNGNIVDFAEFKNGQVIRNNSGFTTQPTIYGSHSSPFYSAPKDPNNSSIIPYLDGTWKSHGFAEGNDIGFMAGVPNLEFFVGLPWRGQFKFFFVPLSIDDESYSFYRFKYNQQINHWFGLFEDDPTMGLAAHYAYFSFGRDGISAISHAFGVHFSKDFENNLTFYAGLQFETMSGEFEADRDPSSGIAQDNPYPEIRNGGIIKFDVESDNAFRIVAGATYTLGAFEFFGDFAYAHQPVLSCGVNIYFYRGGPDIIKEIHTIERYERVEIYKEKETIIIKESDIKTQEDVDKIKEEISEKETDLEEVENDIEAKLKEVKMAEDKKKLEKEKEELEELKKRLEEKKKELEEIEAKIKNNEAKKPEGDNNSK
jgi:uncharacterized protein DUF6588